MDYSFIFFGTEPLAHETLETLKTGGYIPKLIVTTKDTYDKKNNPISPVEKLWARTNGIKTIEPEKISQEFIDEISDMSWDFFVVASYGKILPRKLLEIPKKGVINVHPSLLPKLRGPSPIRSAILQDLKEVGVSIMLLDQEMDHGPLLGQKKVQVSNWPPKGRQLDSLLAKEGADLLLEILPQWLQGACIPTEQDHNKKTFCSMFSKQDGLIDLKDDPYKNYLKICAFEGWPGTYFFYNANGRDIRVKIVDAEFENGQLMITRVIPEGKKEMSFDDFKRGYNSN